MKGNNCSECLYYLPMNGVQRFGTCMKFFEIVKPDHKKQCILNAETIKNRDIPMKLMKALY